MVATDQQYLAWCEEHAQVIFATYAMMKEGIDIPRLDAGVEATPPVQRGAGDGKGAENAGRQAHSLNGTLSRTSGFPHSSGICLSDWKSGRLDHGITIRKSVMSDTQTHQPQPRKRGPKPMPAGERERRKEDQRLRHNAKRRLSYKTDPNYRDQNRRAARERFRKANGDSSWLRLSEGVVPPWGMTR